ncbi:hypothetical protein HPB47_020061, partial [Ixodes persulcatus]
DITLWMGGGSDGNIEATVASAVDIIAVHAGAANLSSSPQKSEVLLLRPSRVATAHNPSLNQITSKQPFYP